MYRLMIVEDEPIVLEGMLKIINFEDFGFEVVSACSNGSEALKNFNKAKPDVVITDICMDLMDGLEFIERASQESSRVKFVVVSGHQDFKFVKKALSLKVLDYILKPVTAKEFKELLTKIAGELNKKKVSLNQFEEVQKSAEELDKNILFNKLINIKLSPKEIEFFFEKHNIELNKKYFRVLILKMDNMHYARNRLGYESSDSLLNDIYYKVAEFCSKYKNIVSFISPQGYVVVIVNEDELEHVSKISKEISEEMRTFFSTSDDDRISCFAGYDVDSKNKMTESFESAAKLIKSGVLKNDTDYYDSGIILKDRKQKLYDYRKDIEEWIVNIIYSDKKAFESVEKIHQNSKQANLLLSDYKKIASIMYDKIYKELSDAKLDLSVDVNIELYSESETTNYLNNLTQKGFDEINKESVSRETYITNKALAYIHKNYDDFNLDLQAVCKHLDISISYFSQIFKKNMDMTFIKYVNNYRIEKAKHFLEHSQKRIGEVSEMVGYIDPHYFGIVFKKHVDTTPKKYRSEKRASNEEA